MITMMITIIPIKRPATRPGFEKKPPLEFVAKAIEGDVDVGCAVGVLPLLPVEAVGVGVGVGVVEVVDDEVELAVELADVDDSVVVYTDTTHEYTAT